MRLHLWPMAALALLSACANPHVSYKTQKQPTYKSSVNMVAYSLMPIRLPANTAGTWERLSWDGSTRCDNGKPIYLSSGASLGAAFKDYVVVSKELHDANPAFFDFSVAHECAHSFSYISDWNSEAEFHKEELRADCAALKEMARQQNRAVINAFFSYQHPTPKKSFATHPSWEERQRQGRQCLSS